ncbi:MAG: hypothetical protein LBB41_07960 [Prevotellaceae bacterium]|jgi:hypothetical protein|nr:hypothetical protein [Prevotellaceae bacterium]
MQQQIEDINAEIIEAKNMSYSDFETLLKQCKMLLIKHKQTGQTFKNDAQISRQAAIIK